MFLTNSHISAQQVVVCAQVCGCMTMSWTVCWTVQLCSTVCCTTTGCATGCTGQVGCGEHGFCPNAISPMPAKAAIAKLEMAFLICLFITSSMVSYSSQLPRTAAH